MQGERVSSMVLCVVAVVTLVSNITHVATTTSGVIAESSHSAAPGNQQTKLVMKASGLQSFDGKAQLIRHT